MAEVTLTAYTRERRGKGAARRLRAEGRIPGIVYGRTVDTQSLSVVPKELMAILSGDYGGNTIFTLAIQDGDGNDAGSHLVMLQDFDRHPVKRSLQHVDFIVVEEDRKLMVDVPIELIGIPKGVKNGGVLKQLHRQITVRCMPKDVPVSLEFDVTPLKVNQRALASHVTPPEGVELVIDNDYAIAQCMVPRGLDVIDDEDEDEDELGEAPPEEGAEAPAAT